jgi:hypothetical protein
MSEQQRIEAEIDELEEILLEEVEMFLSRIDIEPMRNHLHEIVFVSNTALPKRTDRLQSTAPYIAATIYDGLANTDFHRRDLLRFSVVVQEYYDVFDDLLDGDVERSRWEEVFCAHELMIPLLIQDLYQLGADTVEYWTQRTTKMMVGPYTELVVDPEAELYLQIVDNQSLLYGSITGLAAHIAGSSTEKRRYAEQLGCLFFKLHQFTLDLEQHGTDDDSWNAWSLLGVPQATELFYWYQDKAIELAGELPSKEASRLRSFAAIDLESKKTDATL